MGNLTAMKASMISKDQALIITDSAVFNETEPQTAGLAELDSSFSLRMHQTMTLNLLLEAYLLIQLQDRARYRRES